MEYEQTVSFQDGAVVFGRFHVQRSLGAGSIGTVYLCSLTDDPKRQLALKVLSPQNARDQTIAERFRNEIHALYRVSHQNVVRGFEFFRFGDGMAFTMEYVEGCKLSDILPDNKALPIEEVIIILRQLCFGLQAIHATGIVHRDLKPENVLITPQGVVKITDFSVARLQGSPVHTSHGGMLGTVDYLSPEYLGEGDLDARADIYALGILTYQMVTGVLPFAGQNLLEKVEVKLSYDLKPATAVRSDCPLALSNIIERACARDVNERYQDIEEILRDLISANFIQPDKGSSIYSSASKPLVTDTHAAHAVPHKSQNVFKKQTPSPLRTYIHVLMAISAILMVMLGQSLYEIFGTRAKSTIQFEQSQSPVTESDDQTIHVVVSRNHKE